MENHGHVWNYHDLVQALIGETLTLCIIKQGQLILHLQIKADTLQIQISLSVTARNISPYFDIVTSSLKCGSEYYLLGLFDIVYLWLSLLA